MAAIIHFSTMQLCKKIIEVASQWYTTETFPQLQCCDERQELTSADRQTIPSR